MTPYLGDDTKYNLQDVSTYPRVVGEHEEILFDPFKNIIGHETFELQRELGMHV